MIPCPMCQDGQVWYSDGPTGKRCPSCNGFAVVHYDGSKITQEEYEQDDDGRGEDHAEVCDV